MKLYSFPPLFDEKSNVIILGTMPGNESLKTNQYYAHPRNAFWKIMFALFNQPFSNTYIDRQNLLLNNNIALWDVLKSCERKGSLDSAIIKEQTNELQFFLKKQKQIKHVIFNGQKAGKYFSYYFKNDFPSLTSLPSTSPAYTLSFEEKLKAWSAITKMI